MKNLVPLLVVGMWGAALAQPASPPQTLNVVLPSGATMAMVLIPAGTFSMGSPGEESGRYPDEGPQHEVAISRAFYLGKYEFTQGQWQGVMGTTPWAGKEYVREEADRPAVFISLADAQALIARLNAAEGDSLYRLPTEAEWEYACRAGTTTPWYFGEEESQLKDQAWFYGNLGERAAHPVGAKPPNPWGLCDMYGNVWEWVQAVYAPYGEEAGSSRDGVNRGGSFYDKAPRLRSAYRNHDPPANRSADLGLRLVRQIR